MKKGFTLIELLVVIAIIAILAAILFPVFSKAREKARQSTCTSNQKQVAVALAMAIQENEETIPGIDVWSELGVSGKVLQCPTAGKKLANAYVFNRSILGFGFAKIKSPVKIFATADGLHEATAAVTTPVAIGATSANFAYTGTDLVARHDGNIIASFVDGHVETAKIGAFLVEDVMPMERKAIEESSAYSAFDKLSINKSTNNASGMTNWDPSPNPPTTESEKHSMIIEGVNGKGIRSSSVGETRLGYYTSVRYPTLAAGEQAMAEFYILINEDAKALAADKDAYAYIIIGRDAANTAVTLLYRPSKDAAGKITRNYFYMDNTGGGEANASGSVKTNVWYHFVITWAADGDTKANVKVDVAGTPFWEANATNLTSGIGANTFGTYRAIHNIGFTISDLTTGKAVNVTPAGP